MSWTSRAIGLFMKDGLLCLCLLLFGYLGVESVPPSPVWPDVYKTCVNVQTEREFIKAGWYVDAGNRRMRLDSYGIPKDQPLIYSTADLESSTESFEQGLNQSTVELLQYYISHVEDFEYACHQYGPPLYIFIYLYDQGKMLNLFPSPDPPYRSCSISTIFNKFPNSPLLPEVEFVEEDHDNITTFNHWRSESFLFTLDYLFHEANGLPYKMFVNSEEHVFLSFEEGKLDDSTFYPPRGVVCK